jgi:hypothetical protein
MPLSKDERAAINRQNARKSTGPVTPEGKAKSRLNATKHGLRAEVVPLPGEDPEAIAERSRQWNNFYNPQSPAAQHLVNECVAATLLCDRVNRAHDAAVSMQLRTVVAREEPILDVSVAQLAMCPSLARDLRATAAGCEWLLGRWALLAQALEANGCWTQDEADDACRLQGHDPRFVHSSPEIARLLRAANRARALDDDEATDDARAWLVAVLDRERTALQVLAEQRRAVEEPARLEAAAAHAVLLDQPAAKLLLRYRSEARNAFHRNYSALLKTLALDAETPQPSPQPEAVDPAPAASPNEPNAEPPASEPIASPASANPTIPYEPHRNATPPPVLHAAPAPPIRKHMMVSE